MSLSPSIPFSTLSFAPEAIWVREPLIRSSPVAPAMDLPSIERLIQLEGDRMKKAKRRKVSSLETSQWSIWTALCIAILLQFDFNAAAEWLASPLRRGKQIDDSIDRDTVKAELKRLYDEVPPPEVTLWTNPLSSPLPPSCLQTALKWSQGFKLMMHARTANVEYGASVRSARLIEQYNAKLHEDALQSILPPVSSLQTYTGVKWCERWRNHHGASIGKLRVREPVPLFEKRNQASLWEWGYACTIPYLWASRFHPYPPLRRVVLGPFLCWMCLVAFRPCFPVHRPGGAGGGARPKHPQRGWICWSEIGCQNSP